MSHLSAKCYLLLPCVPPSWHVSSWLSTCPTSDTSWCCDIYYSHHEVSCCHMSHPLDTCLSHLTRVQHRTPHHVVIFITRVAAWSLTHVDHNFVHCVVPSTQSILYIPEIATYISNDRNFFKRIPFSTNFISKKISPCELKLSLKICC